MKKMVPISNKNTAILLAIMDVLVVGAVIMLHAMNRISDTTFWTVLIVACLIAAPLCYFAAHSLTAGIKSPQQQAADNADDIPLDGIELPRTPESTIFEAITGAIVIAATAVAIATHFEHIHGRALAGLPIITSWMLYSAYHPKPSFLWGEMHNLWQVRFSARLRRILAVMFATFILLRLCVWFNQPIIEHVGFAVIILTYIAGRIIQITGRNK